MDTAAKVVSSVPSEGVTTIPVLYIGTLEPHVMTRNFSIYIIPFQSTDFSYVFYLYLL